MVLQSESRLISNFGVFELTEEQRKAAFVRFYARMQSPPANRYGNGKYPVAREFLGYWQKLWGGTVMQTGDIPYVDCLLFENYQDYVQLELDLLNALTTAIPTFPGGFVAYQPFRFDRVRIQLYQDATVFVEMYWDEFVSTPKAQPFPTSLAPDIPSEAGNFRSNVPVPPNPGPRDILGYLPGDPPTDPATQDGGETYVPPSTLCSGRSPGVYGVYQYVGLPTPAVDAITGATLEDSVTLVPDPEKPLECKRVLVNGVWNGQKPCAPTGQSLTTANIIYCRG